MPLTDLRSIGIDPRFWYPAVRLSELPPCKPVSIRLWRKPIVVWRTADGVFALEDRCRHRKVRLSEGEADARGIVCPFHGWRYAPDGRLDSIPYWNNGPLPQTCVRSFATRVAGGIVWIFGGESPAPPNDVFFDRIEYDRRDWFHVIMDRRFDNHYSFGVINGMDFFHFHLHRKYQPWQEIHLESMSKAPGRIEAAYEITMRDSRAAQLFKRILSNGGQSAIVENITVEYEYPHHFASINADMQVGVFFRPIDESATQVFIDMHFPRPKALPWLRWLYLQSLYRVFFTRIQVQDAWIGVLEQAANADEPAESRFEVNPVSLAVERVMEERWRAFEAESGRLGRKSNRRAGRPELTPEASHGLH
jgi:phenylpropionate dioxygenase-like ring-hydroxylating dioxygenase large terminal subunit